MKEDLICWDSSVLISWIRGDESAARVQAMTAVVGAVESGAYRLAVSALLYAEVLESTMPAPAIGHFEKFMQNRAILSIVAVDIRVARKAQMIRDTFDSRLLRLNGKSEVDNLAITACDIQ